LGTRYNPFPRSGTRQRLQRRVGGCCSDRRTCRRTGRGEGKRPRTSQEVSAILAGICRTRPFVALFNAEERNASSVSWRSMLMPSASGGSVFVLLVSKSPQFLYREVGNSRNDYDVAAPLTRLRCGTRCPERGTCLLRRGRESCQRGSRSPCRPSGCSETQRGRTKLRTFLLTWLKADQPLDLSRDAKKFPGFDTRPCRGHAVRWSISSMTWCGPTPLIIGNFCFPIRCM
jgi:hypothetical protein